MTLPFKLISISWKYVRSGISTSCWPLKNIRVKWEKYFKRQRDFFEDFLKLFLKLKEFLNKLKLIRSSTNIRTIGYKYRHYTDTQKIPYSVYLEHAKGAKLTYWSFPNQNCQMTNFRTVVSVYKDKTNKILFLQRCLLNV